MIIKIQKPISFNNICGCRVDYLELEKAIIWYSDRPTASLKSIYMHGKYPAISIYDKKIHIHRLLMMYWLNKKLDTNQYVHHINGDRLCALKDNLEYMAASKHQSLANKGKKQAPDFVWKRTNASCISRYGHPRIHEEQK